MSVSRSRSLPLVSTAAPTPSWRGLRPVAGSALDAPEPEAPQGAYGDAKIQWTTSAELSGALSPVELLAPAGGLEAGFAAFHFGADAIYLGMKKFSARAEAENFTPAELSEITSYAHSLSPRRRVFVTINTLIRQDELPELLDTLAELTAAGVDAVIVQDLGVLHAIRRWFPRLELHASTQMAVHNRAGVVALRGLGFRRVVLARELTAEEVGAVTNDTGGVETEVFVHGALCYAYSGLCLFSAQTLGRSGNRGKCSYSCRDSFEVTGAPMTLRDGSPVRRDPREGFPFSMKDLALPDHLPSLRSASVACFKIEGRKKSPLYVATTTDYYRRLLDGTLDREERPAIEADLQTVFSRPWTGLFLRSHKDKEVADRDTVGHRGTRIGKVERVVVSPRGEASLRFRTDRALQKHDGLQVDLAALGKPFGFPIDRLSVIPRAGAKPQNSLTAPAGSHVEVGLPADAPELEVGSPVYCSSSQEVKQRYRFHRPKPGTHQVRLPVSLTLTLTATEVTVRAETTELPWAETPVTATASVAGVFGPANDAAKMETALRDAFARLGSSRYELADFTCRNEAGVFVPVSKLNPLRREVLETLDRNLATARTTWRATLDERRGLSPPETRDDRSVPVGINPTARRASWSIKVDRVGFLDAFADEDWADVDEVVIDITRDHAGLLRERLAELGERIGRERIRLALPALTRAWEEKNVVHKIESLRAAGWSKWEAANLSAWTYLGLDPARPIEGLDLATDWSVYVLNRLAARQLMDMGVSRFCLSPEDGYANSRSLWTEFPAQAVLIAYQDTPLFLAESCAYANLIGGCPGKANCSFESMEMESSHGESVTAIDYHCRTIVLNQGPYCLSPRLADLTRNGVRNLRADFIYRTYEPAEIVRRWRLLRAGRPVPGGHAANWDRGLL
jgi:U32 family peptidase